MEKRELTKEETKQRAERRRHRDRFRLEAKVLTATARAMRTAERSIPKPDLGEMVMRRDEDGYGEWRHERPKDLHLKYARHRIAVAFHETGRWARHWLLAYAFWRGETYRALEPAVRPGAMYQADPKEVLKALQQVDYF